MLKIKIKDMTPLQLKNYRKQQIIKRKNKQEKEKKLAEKIAEKEKKEEIKKAIIRSKSAKKAAITRKKNKEKIEKEKAQKIALKSKSAKKAALTRKKNISIAKKELREKKKIEIQQKKLEKQKNKIIVPKNKPIKDMTQEEYLEYKKTYARIYNERKKEVKEKEIHKNVSRRLSGKTLRMWNNEEDDVGRKFSEIKENSRYIMHPKINNGTMICKIDGINAYCELTASVNLSVSEKSRKAEVSLSFFILPKGISSSHLIVKDFWKKDISDLIPKLTDKNFYKLLQPITDEQTKQIIKWTMKEFIEICTNHSVRHRQQTVEILRKTLDLDFIRKHNINLDIFEEMIKPRRNKK